jgi:hypothetical protein
MKQLTIAYLRSNLANELKDLPFEIIDGRSKEVLAVVKEPVKLVSITPEEMKQVSQALQPKNIIQKIKKDPVKQVKEQIKEVLAKKPVSNLCPKCGSFLNQYGECNNKFKHKKEK